MPTLYVHLDESGNFDFSPTGTRYYVFAVTWTREPKSLADKLVTLRFQLLKAGHDLEAFHATTDKQQNREQVVDVLLSSDTWKFAAVVIEKAKVNPSFRKPHQFYPKFAIMPLQFIFRGVSGQATNKIMTFTDSIPVSKYREAVQKAIKLACRQELPSSVDFLIYHHHRSSNAWLQATDYCSWSVFRKWEMGDDRTYQQLRPRLALPELDVMRLGEVTYYQHPVAP